MLHFFKKNKEKQLQILLAKSWYFLQFLRYRAKLTENINILFGHFLLFYPPKNAKNQNSEKRKNLLEILSFYTCVPKSQSYKIWFLRYRAKHRIFVILGHFLPFYLPHLMIPKNKILKKMKKMPRDIILLYIHGYHKWRSYDMWFLKYKVPQTKFFVVLGHFLPFQPPDNLENQNFKIEKKNLDISFYAFPP